jgi:hypothetical protein
MYMKFQARQKTTFRFGDVAVTNAVFHRAQPMFSHCKETNQPVLPPPIQLFIITIKYPPDNLYLAINPHRGTIKIPQ